MRRLALVAAALAIACSSKKESDTTPPAVPVISAPTPGATIGAAALVDGGKVAFSGTAEAGATVELQVGGTVVATAASSGAGTWTASASVADGSRTAQARAIDAAGNASALCAPVAFTVDSLAPAVPVIVSPLDGAALEWSDLRWPGGQVVFTGTAEPGSTVEIEVTGGAGGTGTAVAAGDGTWSVGLALGGGSYSVRARAIDGALNASAYCTAVAFALDTTVVAQPLAGWPYAPVTSWGQAVPVTANDASGLGELFPGQANSWALDRDFSLGSGYGLQYATALALYAGVPAAPTSHASLLSDLLANALSQFPGDQAISEATFLTPRLDDYGALSAAVSDGASMGIPAISGSSAYLNGTSRTVVGYLLQLAPGETYTFGWTHQAVLDPGRLAGADTSPYAPSYQVVLRDDGESNQVIGAPLFSSSTNVLRRTESVTRSGLPQSALLQFELRSAVPGYAELDDLTVSNSAGTVTLRNPSFESGFDGWSVLSSGSQNVRSGARDVGAAGSSLRVTRTFYAPSPAYAAPPTWGRMVDVFENTAASDVTTTVVYATLLGGVAPFAASTQNGAAVVGWDGAATVRDVGIVFGTGTAYVADGSPFVFVTHDLTVPAGGKIALVHFIVQLGEAAGGASALDVPTATDAECAAILAGYASAGSSYPLYFEPGVRALVANF